jgi:hypothetical protein
MRAGQQAVRPFAAVVVLQSSSCGGSTSANVVGSRPIQPATQSSACSGPVSNQDSALPPAYPSASQTATRQ